MAPVSDDAVHSPSASASAAAAAAMPERDLPKFPMAHAQAAKWLRPGCGQRSIHGAKRSMLVDSDWWLSGLC